MGHNESGVKRKAHSTKCLHKEVEKSHSSKLIKHLKTLEQKENSPKGTSWQEIIKLTAEINKFETKKTRQRVGSLRKSTK